MKRRVGRTPKKGNRRCPSGKTRFRDQASATYVLGNVNGSGHVPKRAYHCGRCSGWHLSSQA